MNIKNMGIEVSVVLCTYNRAHLLRQILSDLEQQAKVNPHIFEVIVVDNNSSDSTREIILEKIRENQNISYYFEPNIGLSYARNKGAHEARGKYVAYIDDDCRIPYNWMMKVLQVIENVKPYAFGGPYLPYYLTQKPFWFKDEYGSFYEGNYPKKAGPAENFNLCGGNFVIRRNILKSLGGFNPQLGMAGNTLAYAEEDHLQNCLRLKWPDGLIYFDPDLFLKHLVAPHKMQLVWRIQQQFARGKSLAILYNHTNKSDSLIKILKRGLGIIIRMSFSLIQGLILRDRRKFPYYQNWIYEVSSLYFAHLGVLVTRLKIRGH